MSEVATQPVRSGHRRVLSIGSVVVALALLGLVGYSCFWPNDRSTYSAPAQRLAAAGVTYIANGPLYIVAQPDGSFLALDEQDRVRDNYFSGCVVRWRGDLQGGIFQEDPRCGGATFDRAGMPVSGGAPLLRHPLRLAGKNVVVDSRQCVAPEQGPAAKPQACAAFH